MTTAPPRDVPFAPVQAVLHLDFRRPPGLAIRPALPLVSPAESSAHQFAGRLAQALVDVGNGTRGPHQLVRWTSPDVHAALVRRTEAVWSAVARPRRVRAAVRSVHVAIPLPGVAEVSVHVSHGATSSAIAARVELLDGRWCCTALEWG